MARQTKTAAPTAADPDIMVNAEPAEGELYETFLRNMLVARIPTVEVANSDFNGRGVRCDNLDTLRNRTKVPLTLTVVNGQYIAVPILKVRKLD